MKLKFYVYISTAKLEMLLPQVSVAFGKKFAAEVGLNLGVLTAKLKTESPADAHTLNPYRAKMLEDYIEDAEDVGSLDSGKAWIKDTLDARLVRVPENPEVFLLLGMKYGMCHLLGGSARHLTGTVAPQDALHIGYSFFPFLMSTLDSLFVRDETKMFVHERDDAYSTRPDDELFEDLNTDEWINAIWDLYERNKAPVMSVEFLGRLLARGRRLDTRRSSTVSSPIYVAQI